ncbi:MAG: LysM peptidoglycan-binding domain-containing protein, partial [Chloroflexota bacterium]
EESTSEDGVNVTDVTIEAPEMTEEPVAETTPAPADTDDESTDVAGQTEYTIVQGDTLFSIARRFGVSVTALAEANDIVNPNRIFWGQVLEIPAEGGTGGPVDPNNPDETLRTYQVREGDTLFRIAANNDTTVTRLLELNPDIENVNVIFIGQDVLIPSS